MGLEPVINEVIARGRKEATTIRKEADDAYDVIVRKAKAEARADYEKVLEKARRTLEIERRHELSSAELQTRRARLVMENELLVRVLKGALDRVRNLPPERDRTYMRALLSKHASEGTSIQCAAKHTELVRTASSLSYVGEVGDAGGVIIGDARGEVRHDLTYVSLMGETYEANLKMVHETLFGKDGDG